jgi:hypothetical protein
VPSLWRALCALSLAEVSSFLPAHKEGKRSSETPFLTQSTTKQMNEGNCGDHCEPPTMFENWQTGEQQLVCSWTLLNLQ